MYFIKIVDSLLWSKSDNSYNNSKVNTNRPLKIVPAFLRLSAEIRLRQRMVLKDTRGGSRIAATSKMEHFVIIVNGWKQLTNITKSFILDVEAVLDPLLVKLNNTTEVNFGSN